MSEILKNIPEKSLENKDTTSLKWKSDVIDFFKDKKLESCLELGTNRGITTKILSFLFKKVYSIEYDKNLYKQAKLFCDGCNNIKFICGDVYDMKTYNNLPKTYNVVVIDCVHVYDWIVADIQRALTFFEQDTGLYIVFDDYGHPTTDVKRAVDYGIYSGLTVEKYIGEDKGFTVKRVDGTQFTLNDFEGIILSYGV